MNDILSIREASKEADVSVGYIRQLIEAGTLQAKKAGSFWVIDRASFNAWQQKRKKRGPGDTSSDVPPWEEDEEPLSPWDGKVQEKPADIHF